MKYDFDRIIDRRSTGSLKWNVGEGELPMWVADMDFETAPAVKEAILEKARQGVFGYSETDGEWADAYAQWWESRHGTVLDKDKLIFATGVVPIISSAVRKLTTVGENVLVQTPTYNIFFNSIVNNGRNAVENRLIYDGKEYSVDFCDLEKKLSDPQTTLMILCNPQNPCGNIWDRDTLSRVGELCRKYGVTVISDEIHCDLTAPGKGYVPFASVSDTCRDISVSCLAPTKAFNIAGIQTAAAYVPNKFLHHRLWRALNTDEVAEPNIFAVTAAVSAFRFGGEWLDELREYLFENRRTAEEYISRNVCGIRPVRSYATYLMWLDCAELLGEGRTSSELARFIRSETGLYLSDGGVYRGDGGKFLRMNLACPKSVLNDGLERLKNGAAAFADKVN